MASCSYVREGQGNCSSRFNLKQVEFRHPDYSDFTEEILLCETHFQIIFSEIIEEERKAYREYERRSKRYKELFHEAMEMRQRNEIVFNRDDFKEQNYGKVASAKSQWMIIIKKRCRLEYCQAELNSRKAYMIRIYPINQLQYKNLFFCSKKHWEAIKRRIGILKETDTKKKNFTLDHYNGVIQ